MCPTLALMADELVFSVDEAHCEPVASISLAEAGLTERAHLQEWVLEHPEMLGPDVLVVTSEFDRWKAAGSAPKDRLDVLGLDSDGRLVVAELKRDQAPETTDMQALKYAAMVSRFTASVLADRHAAFLRQRGDAVTEAEAQERLEAHAGFALTSATLSRPRIVLLATSFPQSVTATAVWLNEMGVDVTLMRFQAYRMHSGEVAVTVSKQYPVPEAEEFAISPVGSEGRERTAGADLPEVPWTASDLDVLRLVPPNPTTQAALDACSEAPGVPVPFSMLVQRSGRTHAEARADLAGLTMLVKSRLCRRNWPIEAVWRAGGEDQMYYVMSPEVADAWLGGDHPVAGSGIV